jgi:hypothetical protein
LEAMTVLALNGVAEALHDRQFEIASVESNERERSRVADNLRHLGFRVYPSAATARVSSGRCRPLYRIPGSCCLPPITECVRKESILTPKL